MNIGRLKSLEMNERRPCSSLRNKIAFGKLCTIYTVFILLRGVNYLFVG